MTRLHVTKTRFTSGELDPELYGSIDLRAFEEGAAKLRNVVVQTSGGIRRRPGMAHLGLLSSARKLISFDTQTGEELVVLGSLGIGIWKDGSLLQSDLESFWTEQQLSEISWTRVLDALIICHPDVRIKILARDQNGTWSIKNLSFDEEAGEDSSIVSKQPFSRFGDPDIAIQPLIPSDPNADTQTPIPANTTVEIRASDHLFKTDHQFSRLKIKGREVYITNYLSSTTVIGLTIEELIDRKTTRFWEESAFGDARGWPIAVTVHQDRLVFGGNRDASDRLWFSKTGKYFNFDKGEGLDDEAMSFKLGSDRLHKIQHLAAGRRLQILTTRGEWVVSGTPLTPTNIQLDLQTTVGAPADRYVRPLDVDGATIFIGASGSDVREFLFADSEQAFQAPDIGLLSRHLIDKPVSICFDPKRRLLLVLREDGRIASAAIDRNANIIAWTLLETGGEFIEACDFNSEIHFLVRRQGTIRLERFADDRSLDGSIVMQNSPATAQWTGFDNLFDAQNVSVLADNRYAGDFDINNDQLDLENPAGSIEAGYGFSMMVEPLPLAGGAQRGTSHEPLYRPIAISFRLLETRYINVDTGRGLEERLNDDAPGVTGDLSIRALGWRRGLGSWPWRIEQSLPLSFNLLSVSSELKVNS